MPRIRSSAVPSLKKTVMPTFCSSPARSESTFMMIEKNAPNMKMQAVIVAMDAIENIRFRPMFRNP